MNSNHEHIDPAELVDAQLTAYALDQLGDQERAEVEARLSHDASARQVVEEIRSLAGHLHEASGDYESPRPSDTVREAVEGRLNELEGSEMNDSTVTTSEAEPAARRRRWTLIATTACLLVAATVAAVSYGPGWDGNDRLAIVEADQTEASGAVAEPATEPVGNDWLPDDQPVATASRSGAGKESLAAGDSAGAESIITGGVPNYEVPVLELPEDLATTLSVDLSGASTGVPAGPGATSYRLDAANLGGLSGDVTGAYRPEAVITDPMPATTTNGMAVPSNIVGGTWNVQPPVPVEYYGGAGPGTTHRVESVQPGRVQNVWTEDGRVLVRTDPASRPGLVTQQANHGYSLAAGTESNGSGQQQGQHFGALPEANSDTKLSVLYGHEKQLRDFGTNRGEGEDELSSLPDALYSGMPRPPEAPGTEQYEPIAENPFRKPGEYPLSTFSIDVDTASYSNVRRFLINGQLPPPAAVRIEELINYFNYNDPLPEGGVPFSVNLEVAQCPWATGHRLLRIGIKGQEVHRSERGPSNLVFLLDVSGSMSDANKLPLVKQGMKLLVKQLTEDDRVAIVTYASNTGVRLPSTCAVEKQTILSAIDALSAGGSTNGGAGIQLAYQQAAEHFIPGGTNRVILATDGDLNVGITDDDDLVELIRRKAETGVFLTVLGFGTGNLKDAKLEKLADKGNGTYAYIDSTAEAHRVLGEELSGSLVTIAKDVKIQVEFNPAEVRAYRLIGYENRVMRPQDFHDDRKDAGEIGAGHSVTALYELVPAGEKAVTGSDQAGLKYQEVAARPLTEEAHSGELLTLSLRYKLPEADQSKLLEFVAEDSDKRFGKASEDLRFASAVAAFGMVLRHSEHCGSTTMATVEEFAAGAIGDDPGGYRGEFLDLVRKAGQLVQ